MITRNQVLTKEFRDVVSGVEYESLAEAARILNVSPDEILQAVNTNSFGTIIPIRNQILVRTGNPVVSCGRTDSAEQTVTTTEIEAAIEPHEVEPHEKTYRRGVPLIDIVSGTEYLSFTHAADCLGVPLRELNKSLNETGHYRAEDDSYDIRFVEGYNPATLRAIKRNICRLLRQNGHEVNEKEVQRLRYQFDHRANGNDRIVLSYANQPGQRITTVNIAR